MICEVCEIGMPRTATRSMAEAMGILGYTVSHGMGFLNSLPVSQQYRANDDHIAHMLWGYPTPSIYGNFEFVGNLPILHWRQIAEENPEVKFVLTVRSEDEWWSRCYERWHRVRLFRVRNLRKSQELPYRQLTSFMTNFMLFGCYGMNEERWRTGFRDHNRAVVEYFHGSDRLLVHNAFAGDGFSELSSFLVKDVPDDETYPHVTTRAMNPVRLRKRARKMRRGGEGI